MKTSIGCTEPLHCMITNNLRLDYTKELDFTNHEVI